MPPHLAFFRFPNLCCSTGLLGISCLATNVCWVPLVNFCPLCFSTWKVFSFLRNYACFCVCACVYVCVPVCLAGPLDGWKGIGSLGGGVTDGCELPSGFWELNPEPFGGQLVLLLSRLFSPCINQLTNQLINDYLFILWPGSHYGALAGLEHNSSSPASAFQALGFKGWIPVSHAALLLLCVGVWARVGRSVWNAQHLGSDSGW